MYIERMALLGLGYILSALQMALLPGLLFSTLLPSVGTFQTEINPPNTKPLRSEYDFIIVGAGSAGAVIANRLSENSEFQVLLLEAGGNATEVSEIPAYSSMLPNTKNDWNYTLGPSLKFCLSTDKGNCSYPRGKVLGGTSTINSMIYMRGNKNDYDNWAKDGNYGWSFQKVLPYFKKSEDNQNPLYVMNKEYHAKNGELTVSDLEWRSTWADIFVKAGQEFGYKQGDPNAYNQTVFSFLQMTIRDGYRCSTNKAFLLPAGKRKNLDIANEAQVTKILIDPSTNRAYGVRYFRYGAYHEVHARKEIILSAGVFNTPQILMLSGIGPKEHLKELNIRVIKDLPVGFNLQDHAGFTLPFLTDKPLTFLRTESSSNIFTQNLKETVHLSIVGPEATAFINSKFQNPEEGHPDLQITFLPTSPDPGGDLESNFKRFSDLFWKSINLPTENNGAFIVIVALLRPKSRGRVLLRSTNPFENAQVKMNYFDEKDDILRLADGARFAIKLMDTEAFSEINGTYYYEPISLCPNALPLSDEYFECYMRYNTLPFSHAVGTVKMGPANDYNAVVDPELNVRNISGLRVADSSIMPRIVSGNTNAPSIMIGEKASDLIKNFWSNKH